MRPQPWAQTIIADQIGRLEAFASEAVGEPVQIDTQRLVGRGLYGCILDLYCQDGRHTGYVLKLTSDWSELLGWSWLQQWDLPGVVSILAVGKGRTEVDSPSGTALPTVIVREKVGSWYDYPDSGIAHDVGLALDAWRDADGRALTGSTAHVVALARQFMGIEHAQTAGAAILRLLKANLIPHDLNKENFGWREDGTLVLLDPSVDTVDPPVRKPKRVRVVLKNPQDQDLRALRRSYDTGQDPAVLKRLYVATERAGERLSPNEEFEAVELMKDSGDLSEAEASRRQHARVRDGRPTRREQWLLARLGRPLRLGDGLGDLYHGELNALEGGDGPFRAMRVACHMRQIELDPWGRTPAERMEEISRIFRADRGIDTLDDPRDDSPLYVYAAWEDFDRPTLFWRYSTGAGAAGPGFMVVSTTEAAARVDRLREE